MTDTYSTEWEASLASTGALAVERQAYKAELIRLGESEDDAEMEASLYVPDPRMLGQAAHAAQQIFEIKKAVGELYGEPIFTLPEDC